MLVKTYDNYRKLTETPENSGSFSTSLLMAGQSVLNANIEIVLNGNAEIIAAKLLDKKTDSVETTIPCTEESISRTGNIAPHPLHDKLQFVAEDYEKFGGKKPGWKEYKKQLDSWCSSEFAHPRVIIVRDFLNKGRLIERLLERNLLKTENNGKVKNLDYFVRFDVQPTAEQQKRLWEDDSVQESFMAWKKSMESLEDDSKNICYVTGQNSLIADKHPKGIIRGSYGAKLISGNDKSNFVFRGRFLEKKEALAISYETSQKAHNMLKWLMENHGFQNGSQVFVSWGTRLQEIPDIYADSCDLFGFEENNDETQYAVALRTEYVKRLNNAMRGYGKNIDDADDIIIMGLSATTPGRASVIFYRELKGSDFLKRIEDWHKYCSWLHSYKFINKKRVPFYGAPAPLDIIKAAYGDNISDTQKKANIELLVHCIIDGKSIPNGLRNSIVRRAASPASMDYYVWQKTLGIACAVICRHLNYEKNKYNTKGGYIWQMAVDEQNKDRSYLFGRLLAYAEYIERYAYYKSDTPARQTNAERMMHSFSLKPAKTWQLLFLRLQSYLRQIKSPGKISWWKKQVDQIIDSIGPQGFNNKALEEQFLLGYSSQMISLYEKKENKESDNNEFEEEK